MLSPEKKFTLKIPATAILQCRTLLPWEKSAFFPKSSALYKIYFLGQNIGTQCYAELINIRLACGTVLWFVTLQAHTCTSYKCHEKLCKTEQTWRTHKSDKCTYIYHQKNTLHCINFKKKGNLWKGHSFTTCRDCISATATVFKTNHYIWCWDLSSVLS